MITEKPARLSFKVVIYASFRSETCFSALATRFPVARDASSGSTDRAMEITVSRGLYQNISTNAPAHIMQLSVMTKILAI